MDLMMLIQLYQSNESFSQHIVLKLAYKLFHLMRLLAEKEANCIKFENYFENRENMLKDPHRYMKCSSVNSQITVEELVVYEFIQQVSVVIEVFNLKKEKLEKVYFMKPYVTNFLSIETKEDFIEQVNVENAQTKLSAIYEYLDRFYMEMQFYNKIGY
jgi:hypothetical protein